MKTLAIAVAELTAGDRGLARIVETHGVPPLWDRPATFATLARIILEQQVSLAAAATLFARLSDQVPGGFTPSAVVACGEAGFRALGVTRQKSRYLCALAEYIEDDRLSLRRLAHRTDSEVISALTAVPGIGPWTSGIYLLMAMRRPDVWPPGDLALHKSIAHLRRRAVSPTSREAVRFAERWAPWRSVAARILWQGYLARTRSVPRSRHTLRPGPDSHSRTVLRE